MSQLSLELGPAALRPSGYRTGGARHGESGLVLLAEYRDEVGSRVYVPAAPAPGCAACAEARAHRCET